MEPRYIVGPPGTGKTRKFLVEKYKECFPKYNPEKIILLSHTQVAVGEIRDAIMNLKEVKEKGYKEKFFEHRICTIHHYCKHKLFRKERFENDDFKDLCRIETGFRQSKERDIEKHPLLKFVKEARGNGRDLDKHWNRADTDKGDCRQAHYSIEKIKELNVVYENYKRTHRLQDFADMIDEFNSLTKESDVEVFIMDEAQDANVPQLKAARKIAKNVKDGHFYLVGDPDQTIYEYAGSDADSYHTAAAKPFLELKQGLRCGEAINNYCKKIISPIWDHYESPRIWLPAEGVKGHIYTLTDLRPSKNLDILLDKMRNTKQTFLFSFRGAPSEKYITAFLKHHAFEFSHIDNSAYVKKKELRSHHEWPKFRNGEPKWWVQVKDFHSYLGSKAIVRGRGKETFKEWVKKDYTYNELVKDGYYLPNLSDEFDLLVKKQDNERMIYIKKVLKRGFDFKGDIRIKYGSIHKAKGTTFDNVVGDLTLYRARAEARHVQLRLKYTMFSRGIYDAWVLKSQTGKEIGNYGRL